MCESPTRTEGRPSDRRVSVRYQADHPARLLLDVEPRLSRWARIHDLSTGGLSLRLCGDLRPGCRLTVEFSGGNPPRRALDADVIHSTALGDGTWLVGCRLPVPLADAEVRSLASFEEPAAQPSAVVSEPLRPVVLIVDDEPAVRSLLVNYLAMRNVTPLEAEDGENAVALLEASGAPVGLAFVDLRLPGLDGLGTMNALKKARPTLPCCLMSGDVEDEQRLFMAGACAVLRKPFALSHVGACLSLYVLAPP